MPREIDDDLDLDSLVRVGSEEDPDVQEQVETPEGEEEQPDEEGLGEREEDAGDAEERDEGEDEEGRPDLLVQEDEEEPKPNGRQRRSSKRWDQVQEELAEKNRKLAEAEARLRTREEEQQREAALRQQQFYAQEQDRLAQMTPDERNTYEIEKLRNQVMYQDKVREFQVWDSQDKASYEAIANSDSALGRLYKKNASTVEKHLTDLRARNTNIPRHVLLKYEIGEQVFKAMANGSKQAAPKPTRKTPKAPTSRGDASRTPSRSNPSSDRDARKKRLEGIRL